MSIFSRRPLNSCVPVLLPVPVPSLTMFRLTPWSVIIVTAYTRPIELYTLYTLAWVSNWICLVVLFRKVLQVEIKSHWWKTTKIYSKRAFCTLHRYGFISLLWFFRLRNCKKNVFVALRGFAIESCQWFGRGKHGFHWNEKLNRKVRVFERMLVLLKRK